MAEPTPSPYKLMIEKRPKYIYALIQAPQIDRATALEYLGEIMEKCAGTRTKRLLLHRDIPTSMNDDDLMLTMNELVSMSGGMKIAFLNEHAGLHDSLRNAVAIGSGVGADYKFFENENEAEEWLTSGSLRSRM